VGVISEVGKGTIFTIYLPRVSGVSPAIEPEESEPLVEGHGICVLVVEDNADVGEFSTQTLNELGFVTELAPNADAALAQLARDPDRFDIVFSDVVMPGMSGVELANAVRDKYPGLPVVLTSGYSHVLAKNGTYGFQLLHKPYSIDQLSRILRKVARRSGRPRLSSDELPSPTSR